MISALASVKEVQVTASNSTGRSTPVARRASRNYRSKKTESVTTLDVSSRRSLKSRVAESPRRLPTIIDDFGVAAVEAVEVQCP